MGIQRNAQTGNNNKMRAFSKAAVIIVFVVSAFISNAWLYTHGGLMFDNYHDSIAQMVPFTYLLQQCYEEGEYFWSWAYGLGGDIFSEFTFYYTTSPFFFLQFLLAKMFGFIGAPILTFNHFRMLFCIIKQVIIMLTMFGLLRYERIDRTFAVMSSVLYGCSYCFLFLYIHLDFFTDPFFWLPVTILAYNFYKRTNNWLPLMFSIALTVGNSFYFGYMSCIFYGSFFLLFSLPDGRLILSEYIKELVKLTGISLLAICVSAAAFLPSVMVLFSADRQQVDVKYGLLQDAQFIKALPELLFTNYGLFCFPLICVLIIFINWNKAGEHIRKKTIVTVFWGLMILFPFWGSLMNGLSYVTDRWYYIVIFLVCYSLPEWLICLNEQRGLSLTKLLLTIALTIMVFKTRSARTVSYNALSFRSLNYLPTDIIPIILSITAIIAFYLWQKNIDNANNKLFKFVMVILILVTNMFYTNANAMQGLFITEKDLVNSEIAMGSSITRETHSLLKPAKHEFYRVDNGETQFSYFPANQSDFVLDYTTSAYNSLINKRLHSWLIRKCDIHSPVVAPSSYLGFDDRYYLETLWGVKYKINSTYNGGYYDEKSLSNGRQVLENTIDTGIDNWYDTCISEEETTDLDNAEYDTAIYQTAILGEDIRQTIPLRTSVPKNITDYVYFEIENAGLEGCRMDGKSIIVDKSAKITFDIPADFYNNSGELLASVTIKELNGKQFTYSINGKTALRTAENWKWTYHLDEFSTVLTEDRDKLILELSEGIYYIDNVRVGFTSFSYIPQWAEQRNRYNLESITIDGSRINGKISNKESGILALSIPFSKGWHCNVDGTETQLFNMNGIFTGIYLEPGDHTVDLYFFPPYLKIGVAVSLISIIIAICIFLMSEKKIYHSFC